MRDTAEAAAPHCAARQAAENTRFALLPCFSVMVTPAAVPAPVAEAEADEGSDRQG